MAILRSPEAILIGSNNEPFINAAKHFKMINIKTQPKAVTAETGKKVSFTVKASGDALTYQWQYSDDNGKTWKNSTAVSDKTATLSITVNEKQTNRLYHCVITNKYGVSVTSNNAKLIVKAATTTASTTVKTTKATTTVKTTAKTTAKSTTKAATTVKTTAKTTAKSTTKAATTVKTTAKTTTKAA